MQKERRAKNCFEDLTTQLQEEVKLVTRLPSFPVRPSSYDPRVLLQAIMDMGFVPRYFILVAQLHQLEASGNHAAYHCARCVLEIQRPGLVMQVPFLQTEKLCSEN